MLSEPDKSVGPNGEGDIVQVHRSRHLPCPKLANVEHARKHVGEILCGREGGC
jgi:hypothetical protein